MTFNELFKSGQKTFQSRVAEEFAAQPLKDEAVLTDTEIAHLPLPVKKYLEYTGALGRSIPRNVRIEFEAEMFRKPGDAPMKARSCQYNFLGSYSRIFQMEARKMFIPFRARHIYRKQQATFVVRVAGLFNVVDLEGDELTRAETVTVLNDLCLFAPGGLADKRLSWSEIDATTAKVTLVNGPYTVSATLFFNPKGDLINFISDDRSALMDDGTLKQARWSTPVGNYREIQGRRVPAYGETIWHYPEGDFVYGRFRLAGIRYNLSSYE